MIYCLVNYSCNNQCIFCATDTGKHTLLNTEQVKQFIDKAFCSPDLPRNRKLLFTGGEPTIRKDILHLISYSKEKYNASIGFLTNARRCADDTFSEGLKDAGLDWVVASIYGHTAERHDQLTNTKGSFDETVSGISNLINYGIKVEVRTLANKFSADSLPDIIKFMLISFPDAVKYSITSLDICGDAFKNRKRVAIRYTDAMPHLEKAIHTARQYNKDISLIKFPLCIFNKQYQEAAYDGSVNPKMYLSPDHSTLQSQHTNMTFPKVCDGCFKKEYCCGLYTSYYEYFGSHELNPIFEDVIPKPLPHYAVYPRGDKSIVIDPESASWMVLDDQSTRELLKLQGTSSIKRLAQQENASIDDYHSFFSNLYENGLVSINGNTMFRDYKDISFNNSYPYLCILHMSESCNLKCNYCYAHTGGKTSISEEVIENAVTNMLKLPVSNICFEFHGGEPLLHFEKIRYAVGLANKINAKYQKRVSFSVVTNGTVLTEDMADFLRENHFKVGLSMDGPREIHDRNRFFHNGKGSFDLVFRSLRLMQEKGLNYGVITVVTRDSIERLKEVFDFFVENGVVSLKFNPLFIQGRANSDMKISNLEFAKAHLALAKRVYAYNCNGRHKVAMGNIRNLLRNILIWKRNYMCMRSPCGAGIDMVGIDCSGGIFPCEEMELNKDLSIGNIKIDSLKEVLDSSPMIESLKARRVENVTECKECDWRNFCGGGCRNKILNQKNGIVPAKDPQCSYYKYMYENLIWWLYEQPNIVDYMLD